MKKKALASLFPVALLGIGFAALYFLPPLFQKKHFKLEGTPDKRATELLPFPKETKFNVIQSGNSGLKVGSKVSLSELLKDSPLIINFWATWCPPCIDEFPSINVFSGQLDQPKDKKLPRLVTISVDEAASDVTKMYQTLDFTPSVLVLHDPNGVYARAIGTTKFPETYFLAQDGKPLYKWVGPQSWLSGDVLRKIAQVE